MHKSCITVIYLVSFRLKYGITKLGKIIKSGLQIKVFRSNIVFCQNNIIKYLNFIHFKILHSHRLGAVLLIIKASIKVNMHAPPPVSY